MAAIADSISSHWSIWKVVHSPFDNTVAMEHCWRPEITYRTEEDACTAIIQLLPLAMVPWEVFEARWVVKTNIMAAGG